MLTSVLRIFREKKNMGAARATAVTALFALLAVALTSPLHAAEPETAPAEAVEITPAPGPGAPPPGQPQASEKAALDEPAAPSPNTPVGASGGEQTPTSHIAQPTQPDIAPPDLPGTAPTLTLADRLPAAIAARLGDPQASLHRRLPKKEREAIAAFYAIGNYHPLWLKDGAWTASAKALIERLKRADEDGLDAADYAVPALSDDSAPDLADADLKLSAAVATYARDARGGRIELARISSLITPKLELPAADAVLTILAAADNPGAALAAYNPGHAGYAALKAKLAQVRAGQSSRSRLEGDIIANMERWRWLPLDMGRRHIWVNVPEYKLRLMQDGQPIHEARVVVGKPDTPTPIFSDEMDHAVVNPSWHVPPSIFKNEFNSDPALAAARGYEVVRSKNGTISIRQPPGERNALGFIKFMFPNRHAVYLHDTPSRRLFTADKRAFSHGCVRLDQPFRFGQLVLGSEWTEARLKSLIGRGERTIRLPEKIPVHLTYFTLQADDKGEFRQIADLYGVNGKVRVALGLPQDGVAVAQAPHPRKLAPRQTRPRPVRTVETVRRAQARPVQAAARPPMPAVQPFFWWQ
jgi:murein L,D-transpeptidase YcbB/YkuD